MTIVRDIVSGLIEDEFRVVGGLYDSPNISDDTRYICLYKQVGAILYSVAIINCDKEYDYKNKVTEIYRFFEGYYHRLEVKNIMLTTLLVTENCNNDMIEYGTIGDFNPDNEVIESRWIVERENKKIIINCVQPDKILNIKEIIQKALVSDGAYVEPMHIKDIVSKNNEKRNALIKSKNNILTITLLIINIIVLVLMELSGGSENIGTLLRFGALERNAVFKHGEIYRLITNMFLHIGVAHLTANSLSLYILGTRAERYYGKSKMIIIYLLSGIGAGLAGLTMYNTVSAGASGAIFGLMGALLAYTMINKKSVDGMDMYFVLIFAIIGLGSGFFMQGISNAGHMGGFVTGFAVSCIMNKTGAKDKV